MIYCNYCQKSIRQLDRAAMEEGWGRLKCDLTRSKYREGPESQEVRTTFIITHCPDHFHEAHNELIERLAKADYDTAGCQLKASPVEDL